MGVQSTNQSKSSNKVRIIQFFSSGAFSDVRQHSQSEYRPFGPASQFGYVPIAYRKSLLQPYTLVVYKRSAATSNMPPPQCGKNARRERIRLLSVCIRVRLPLVRARVCCF